MRLIIIMTLQLRKRPELATKVKNANVNNKTLIILHCFGLHSKRLAERESFNLVSVFNKF